MPRPPVPFGHPIRVHHTHMQRSPIASVLVLSLTAALLLLSSTRYLARAAGAVTATGDGDRVGPDTLRRYYAYATLHGLNLPLHGGRRRLANCANNLCGRFKDGGTCKRCPLGRHLEGVTNSGSCKQCASGKTTYETGACTEDDCKACPGGYVQEGAGCTQCDNQQYTPSPENDGDSSATSCSDCPNGWWSLAGHNQCSACGTGKYRDTGKSSNPLTAAQACYDCPSGYSILEASAIGQSECTLCGDGYYQDEEGAAGACKTCPSGRYTFGPLSGRATVLECDYCPLGFYQGEEGKAACSVCQGTTTTINVGQSVCVAASAAGVECVAGQYNHNGECAVCPPGRYSDASGSDTVTACTPCLVGYFLAGGADPVATDHDSAQDCEACPAGKFNGPDAGATACHVCRAGKYTADPAGSMGHTSCEPCSAGRYLQDDGLTAALHDGSGSCQPCARGRYAAAPGARRDCIVCATGKVNPVVDIDNFDPAEHDAPDDCKICDEGQYSDSSTGGAASGSCSDCPAGYHSVSLGETGVGAAVHNRAACQACPAGKSNPSTGRHGATGNCVLCISGRYADSAGRDGCDACGAGRFLAGSLLSNHDEESDCQVCSPGKWSAASGSEQDNAGCNDCPAGRFLQYTPDQKSNPKEAGSHDSLDDCAICPAGLFNAHAGLDEPCTPCPAGTFLADAATDESLHSSELDCGVCGLGTFAKNTGSVMCSQCPRGWINPYGAPLLAAQHQACDDCQRGKYTANEGTGRGVCTPCPAGTSNSFDGAGWRENCTDCTVGRYQTATGQQACLACPVGKFGDTSTAHGSGAVDIASGCSDCSPGMSSSPGAFGTTCTNCSIGTYLSAEMAGRGSACLNCPGALEAGATFCPGCRAGKYGTDPNCVPCPAGRFSEGGNVDSCAECPQGYHGVTGNLSGVLCDTCPAGTWFAGTGASGISACVQCGKGRHGGNNAGSISETDACVDCVPGTYGPNAVGTGVWDCFACAPGRFGGMLPGRVRPCEGCRPGEYLDRAGQTGPCGKCPGGWSAPSSNASTCAMCLPGLAQAASGRPLCQPCSAGRYAPEPMALTCVDCPAGFYQHQPGQASCTPCIPGRFAGTRGLQTCEVCPTGRYIAAVGHNTSSCNSCPGGKYQSEAGQAACLKCIPGTVGGFFSGRSSCLVCGPGFFAPTEGRPGDCLACLSGQSQSNWGAAQCVACIPGQATADNGAGGSVECTPCGAGTFTASPSSGSWPCKGCPRGFMQPDSARASCLACGTGKVQPGRGQQACEACLPGRFAAGTGLHSCSLCPLGKHTGGAVGAAACSPCSAGRKGRRHAADPTKNNDSWAGDAAELGIACPMCRAGHYRGDQDDPGVAVCLACAPGYAMGDVGASACLPCVPGRTQVSSGATGCDECSANSFAPGAARRSRCQLCPAGQSSSAAMPACQACVAGKAGLGGNGSACSTCPAGTSRGNQDAATACVVCTAGFYAPTPGGATFCLGCDAGQLSPLAGSTECTMCPSGLFQDEKRGVSCKSCSGGLRPNQFRTACEKPPWKIPSDCKLNTEFLNTSGPCNTDSCSINTDTTTASNSANRSVAAGGEPTGWRTWTCDACPAFAKCAGHVSWDDVVPLDGHKQLLHNRHFFAPCPVFAACDWSTVLKNQNNDGNLTGNAATANTSRQQETFRSCRKGHDPSSTLCSQCLPGWAALRRGYPCQECPPFWHTAGVMGGLGLLVTLVFMLLVADAIDGATDMIPLHPNDTSHSTEMPFHSIAIRILSSYMQVSGMLLNFDLHIPPAVESLIRVQKGASSLGEQLLVFDCVMETRKDSQVFLVKQIVAAWVMPAVGVISISVFWAVRHYMCRGKADTEAHIVHELQLNNHVRVRRKKKGADKKQQQAAAAKKEEETNPTAKSKQIGMQQDSVAHGAGKDATLHVEVPSFDGFVTTVMVLFYTLYPSLVNRMAITFSCVSYDNGQTDLLTEALSVRCWSGEHTASILMVGVPGGLFYLFVLPLTISVTLRRQRINGRLYPSQRNYDPRWTMRFSFMFAGYREGFEWWESIVMARKCGFVLLAIFLRPYGPSAQVIAASIVLSLSVSAHLQYRPYFDQGLNWLESLSLQVCLAQLLTALLANVLTHGRRSGILGSQAVSSTASVGPKATVVLVLVFFGSTIIFVWSAFRSTVRGSHLAKGAVGEMSRCCLKHCHKHVFGSHTVGKRKRRSVGGRLAANRLGHRPLFARFFAAVDKKLDSIKVSRIEGDAERHEQERRAGLEARREREHKKVMGRLEKRKTLQGGSRLGPPVVAARQAMLSDMLRTSAAGSPPQVASIRRGATKVTPS